MIDPIKLKQFYRENRAVMYQNLELYKKKIKDIDEVLNEAERGCTLPNLGHGEMRVDFRFRKDVKEFVLYLFFAGEEGEMPKLKTNAIRYLSDKLTGERRETLLDVYQRRVKRLEADLRFANSEDDRTEINLDELKQIPIESVLNRFGVTVKKNVCLCPFHKEDTPSCHVYKSSNSFYCFGCNKGGSVIDLVMGLQNVDIAGAIKVLSCM